MKASLCAPLPILLGCPAPGARIRPCLASSTLNHSSSIRWASSLNFAASSPNTAFIVRSLLNNFSRMIIPQLQIHGLFLASLISQHVYFFSALAGITWYFQFFFYNMGESQMGAYGFASWTLHMASIIIFSTLWGVYFKEWSGVSKTARRLIAFGIATLIASTVVIGYGTWLNTN